MKHILIDYPGLELEFMVRKNLITESDMTDYLQDYLKKNKIDIPNHDPEDMVVEEVIYHSNKVQTWIVGS